MEESYPQNYLASKTAQIKIENSLKGFEKKKKEHILTATENNWNTSKKLKFIFEQDPKFNYRQILKNFKINKEEKLKGFSNKYINLFTDLLYENNKDNYSKKRLSLVNFRKKVLQEKIDLSFEEFLKQEPKTERFDLGKDRLNNAYLIKEYHDDKTAKLYSKFFDKNKFSKILFSSNNILLQSRNKKLLFNRNFHTSKSRPTTFTDYNNNDKYLLTSNEKKYLNSCDYRNLCQEEQIYFSKLSPRDDFINDGNKAKYIDYLKNSYHFFSENNEKEEKDYADIKQRKLLFYSGKDRVKCPIDYPYKKEFFNKFNRLKKTKLKNELRKNNKFLPKI